MPIGIDTELVGENTLVAALDIPRRVRPFFCSREFVVRYDESIVDCPRSLYSIPVLSTVLPIAWAESVDVHVDCIDRRFQRAITDIRVGYARLFGEAVFGGRSGLIAQEVQETNPDPVDGLGLLFSGGVDSIAALLRHRDELRSLFTVHGADVQFGNERGFQKVIDRNRQIATEFDANISAIQSNFRDCLNTRNLNLYYHNRINRFWWPGVQHGIALPGLCAPLVHERSLRTLCMASSYSSDPDYPTLQPYITNNLCFGGTRTELVLGDSTRQQRINTILDWVDHDGSNVFIRSCYHDDSGANCNECEKCYRTILGIAVAGGNPEAHGYRYDTGVLQSIRSGFEMGEIILSPAVCEDWEHIQAAVDPPSVRRPAGGDDGFFDWFSEVNLSRFSADLNVVASRKRRLLQVLPPHVGCRIASVYGILKQSIPTGEAG